MARDAEEENKWNCFIEFNIQTTSNDIETTLHLSINIFTLPFKQSYGLIHGYRSIYIFTGMESPG